MKKPRVPPNINQLLKNEKNKKIFYDYLRQESILEFISKMNSKYLHWNELLYQPFPKDSNPEIIWALMKFIRRRETISIPLKQNKDFIFKYKLISDFFEKSHIFDLQLGGSLQSGSMIPDKDKEKYLINSIMEEAIASSQLEGAVTTRKKAKQMLRSSRKPKNKSEQMIVNNYRTINKIIKMKDMKITPNLILEIHAQITQQTLTDINTTLLVEETLVGFS